MNNFSKRSSAKELLDSDNIPFADIRQNMKELNTINSMLGGHAITIEGVKQITGNRVRSVHICEIGCGGGDNLNAIDKWCRENKIEASFTGIDIKKECIDYAKETRSGMNATWITSDYQTINFQKKPDIIFSSLFCHHFNNEQLVAMIKWMEINCTLGFFINDLQRHPLPYHLIRIITQLFSSSYLVKNDAPLSVARGFKKRELSSICKSAGIENFSLQWKWAFRYLLIFRK